jgi:hypothetical protein
MTDNLIKQLGLQVELLTSFVEDLMRQVADIYKELDMVDEEYESTSTYDFCECDYQYCHICQDMHRV